MNNLPSIEKLQNVNTNKIEHPPNHDTQNNKNKHNDQEFGDPIMKDLDELAFEDDSQYDSHHNNPRKPQKESGLPPFNQGIVKNKVVSSVNMQPKREIKSNSHNVTSGSHDHFEFDDYRSDNNDLDKAMDDFENLDDLELPDNGIPSKSPGSFKPTDSASRMANLFGIKSNAFTNESSGVKGSSAKSFNGPGNLKKAPADDDENFILDQEPLDFVDLSD